MNEPTVTQELAALHGLNGQEYDVLLGILGRVPSLIELGIYSAMWSEHCSYKSSKVWLKQLPTTAPWVIHGPGENAGVIDIGNGQAAVFKMESHNHPSYIEPFQGAATGVGGILRDVFTMGARPVANLNALRFGSPDHPRTRHLVAGVVAGIGHYGNCVGVPTVGGETNFHAAYNGNCLVNAMTVGIAAQDRIFLSQATGVGNPVVYVGARTGRDGIHGATMSSAEFSEDSETKRPTVQVGDPFTEKLLIEACLELMATDAIIAIQDMGAAGLTSSSVEMAGKGGLGIVLDLEHVPTREPGMTPYEIMLSESQERMLLILRPGAEDIAARIFAKWQLDCATIGRLTDSGRLVIRMHGRTYADLALEPLFEQAPLYHRPTAPSPAPAPLPTDLPVIAADQALLRLLGCPDLANKRWIWEQYDSQVGADTLARSGQADAAVVRVHGTTKSLAMTTDCTPRYCKADPVQGGRQAVAEAWRNLTCVGAQPLAITDNLNFGDPTDPVVMGQLAGCVTGMAEACRALDFPVVSGNVSLYNATDGVSIPPTPAIGGVGLLQGSAPIGCGVRQAGDVVILVGEYRGHLGQSLYLRELHGAEAGLPPLVDLAAERRHGDFVRDLITAGRVTACHDIADGGLLVAVAEMALAGSIGMTLDLPPVNPFGEDQGCYVLTMAQESIPVSEQLAKDRNIPWRILGTVGGNALTGPTLPSIPLDRLRAAHEAWLPAYMDAMQ